MVVMQASFSLIRSLSRTFKTVYQEVLRLTENVNMLICSCIPFKVYYGPRKIRTLAKDCTKWGYKWDL